MSRKITFRSALVIVLIFGAAGPLIGLPCFAFGIAVASLSPPIFIFFVLYGILFAHLIGGVPALIAGVLVAAYAMFRGSVPVWFGAVAGVIGMAGIYDVQGMLDSGDQQFARALQVLVPLTCAIAGAACTLLTRRWQKPAVA